MSELINILKDAKNGSLPRAEWLGFTGYLFRKIAWFFILVAVLGSLIVLR